jgi:predicted thioesterase
MAELVPGLTGSVRVTVAAAHTAAALGSGDLPVYGTPALVALLEQAAMNALAPHLTPEETTVGTRIELSHTAATPVGMEVRAEAELVAVEGRRLTFTVAAFDARERIGEGRHQRMLLTRDRFLAKVREKA